MKRYILEITAFLCGAVVMILELVGSRVIAPYLGTSTFVWTSIIGVILASLSLGYWWGGKIADRNPSSATLARAIFIGGILTAAIAFLEHLIGWFATIGGIRFSAMLTSLVFFAPATIAFGMVSPLVIKLRLTSVENTGSTVGKLYALSTIGSIAGTFLGGFYLISIIGTKNILLLIGAVAILNALVLSILYGKKKILPQAGILAIIILYLSGALHVGAISNDKFKLVLDTDTAYNRLLVLDGIDRASGEPVRYATNNINLAQSGMYIHAPSALLAAYTQRYNLVEHFNPDFNNALLIGAGAYSYPKYFQKFYPEKSLDVVELDPGFTKIAKDLFSFKESGNVHISHEDGRTFLNSTKNTYDAIFMDAFPSQYAIPFQLATVEAIQEMSDHLSPNGMVISNIASAVLGEKSEFLQAEYATYKKVFPQVLLFRVEARDPFYLQNVMIVALKSTSTPAFTDRDPDLQKQLDFLWSADYPTTLPVLTDDFAPVDKYIDQLY